METWIDLLWVAVGVAGLYWGGEALVVGAVHMAGRLRVSAMVVGLTVVSFATSCPELAASMTAVFSGASPVAVGNVLGSNIANIGLILGLAIVLKPLVASRHFLTRTIPFMLVASAAVGPMMLDGEISRLEGGVLVGLLVVYLIYLVQQEAEDAAGDVDQLKEQLSQHWPLWRSLATVAVGILMLVVGARLLVQGAVDFARLVGISERVIGLTMVALGTSLPELASTLVAVRRGESDLVLGNLVGSNIFNVLAILGITALARPIPVEAASMRLDFWVMLGISALVLPALHPRLQLGRPQGVLFLALYLGYVVWLLVPV